MCRGILRDASTHWLLYPRIRHIRELGDKDRRNNINTLAKVRRTFDEKTTGYSFKKTLRVSKLQPHPGLIQMHFFLQKR